MKRGVQLVVKLAVTAALLAWVAHSVDLTAARRSVAALPMSTLALSVGLFVLQALVLGWRWHRIVGWLGEQLPLGLSIRWVFIGLFFNQALPSSVGGDGVRVWLLHRRGAAVGVPFASVAIERGTGVTMLGLITSASALTLPPEAVPAAVRLTLLLIGPALVLLMLALGLADRLPGLKGTGLLQTQAAGLGRGLRTIASYPGRLLEVMALGAMTSLCGLLGSWVLGQGLGLDLNPLHSMALIGGATLLAVVPVSLGGWGLRETTMISLFGLLGASQAPVLAMAFLTGLLPLLVALPAGLLWRADRGNGREPLVTAH